MESLEFYRQTIEAFDKTKTDHIEESVLWTIRQLDNGALRVAEREGDTWKVNAWIKKAISIFFKIAPCKIGDNFFDKIPLKFDHWTANDFLVHEIRVVPGAIVRIGSFFNKHVVLMNSFINIGTYVDCGTMIDSFATIGSCVQIGKKCHVSAGVVLGGVLEPLTARPVIIEDHCFIGAHACIVEGVVVREGATVAMGTRIGASTKIIDRETGKITYGEIPRGMLAVPGSYQTRNNVSVACVVLVKEKEVSLSKNTALNKDLREKND